MNFVFIPKRSGKPIPELAKTFEGTKNEAWKKAKKLAGRLCILWQEKTFTIRVEIPDKRGVTYELDAAGHTVDNGPATSLTPPPARGKLN